MTRLQKILIPTLGAMVLASVAVPGGYAWYLRSAPYRNSCAKELSESLGLACEIGQVVPLTLSAQGFRDIHVWLPERRGRAAHIHYAELRYVDRQTGGTDDYELMLAGGGCEISTRTWLRDDYRFVMESGLRPGFQESGPRRVVLNDLDIAFERNGFQAHLAQASGVIHFDETASATIACGRFNDYELEEPAMLVATVFPTETGTRIDRLELRVPTLPVRTVGLRQLAGAPLDTGSFGGTLRYAERDGHQWLTLSGRCAEISFAELSQMFLPTPWRGGSPEAVLDELIVCDGKPVRLHFRGRLAGLYLGDLLSFVTASDVPGDLALDVRTAELTRDGIRRLIAQGECAQVDLQRLTQAFSLGQMTGTASLRIEDLTIVENRLVSLQAVLEVVTEDAAPAWVGRDLLLEVLERALGSAPVGLGSILPEQIQYSRLGLRVRVEEETLYLHGLYGPKEDIVLTLRAPGFDFDVREPRHAVQLAPLLDRHRNAVLNRWSATWSPITTEAKDDGADNGP